MRAKLVNEAIKHMPPRSEEELEKNRGPLKERIAAITIAMKNFAKQHKKRLTINNDDPEYFTAGISHKGNYYGIGLNPDNDLPFEAQYEDGQHPQSDSEEVSTIEEAIEIIECWMDYDPGDSF